MRRLLLPLAAVLLFLAVYSLPFTASRAFEDPRELKSLKVRMDFGGTAAIVGTAASMTLSIYNVPQNGTCTVPVETDSDGKSFVRVQWENPGDSASYFYSCIAEVRRDNGPKLPRDEPIPLENFGNYTAPSELVVITPDIASKAQELIDGVDGEFLAASILSSWVHSHMKYDKSYFGRVLNSEQIFGEMVGVCEEYSHLLIAMLRSVGIPSRYVTGFVYGQGGWDPHAWVEVYFPEQDVWIPFDPTYGENGYVDASHIRFFDSLDGSFAAFRTTFTYNALVEKPSIEWDEPNPNVTVGTERTGYELLDVNVAHDEWSVKIGKYAPVKAEVKNNAGTLLYPKLRLVYLAKNLGSDENLELAYGNETVSFALAPNEKKEVYWVLKVKSRYVISPKVMAENTPFESRNITGLDVATSGPDSELLEIFSDRDGYRKNDIAKVTVTNNGKAEAVLTEMTTGTSKPVSAGGRAEFEIPAINGEAAVYSSTGELARMLLPVYDSGLNARLIAPDRAIAGRAFEVVISSPNPTLSITASVSNKSLSGSGLIRFNNTLSESGVIVARISAVSGETDVLRKYIEVLPAPEIFLSQIASSRSYLNVTVNVRNGLMSSARVLSDQSSHYERLSGESGSITFKDKSAKCGKRLKLRIEATGTDLLGQDITETYNAYGKVRCSFFETLIQTFFDVFISPFFAS